MKQRNKVTPCDKIMKIVGIGGAVFVLIVLLCIFVCFMPQIKASQKIKNIEN